MSQSGINSIISAGAVLGLVPDSGIVALPLGGLISVAGGTGINTVGTANTITINLDSPVTVTNGGTGVASITQFSFIYGNGTNPVIEIGPLTNGQLIIGSTGLAPVASTLTAGSNISISNGAGSITITGIPYITWNSIAGTSQSMVVNNGYYPLNVALTTITLPATITSGQIVAVGGYGSGGWRIAQNAGQTIHFGNMNTTTGAGGRLDSTNRYDSIELLCVVTDTDFVALSSVGNITVT